MEPPAIAPGVAPQARSPLTWVEVLVAGLVVAVVGYVGMVDLGNAGYLKLEGDPSHEPLAEPLWALALGAGIAVTLLVGWRRPLRWRAVMFVCVAASSWVAWFPVLVAYILIDLALVNVGLHLPTW